MNDPLRILLIDDNPDDRTLIMRGLRQEFPDLKAEEVTKAKGFAQALEAGDFNLVITDYQVRWTDGLEVLRRVKARWPDCPVIMFTNTGNEEIAVEAMKAGLDDYVVKSPIRFVRLPAAVRLALERVQQRQAMKEAETRYRSLFNGMPVGLYRTTPEGQILDANPALVHMLGYPDRQTLLAVNAPDLCVNPEEHQRWLALMEREGVVLDFEAQVRRGDGTVIWVRHSARAVRGAEGRALYYEGVAEDITERKRAEAALRESELWLRGIFNSQEDAVFVLAPNRMVINMNVAARRMLGYSLEEVKDLSTEILHVDHQRYVEFGERIREAFARGEVACFEFLLKRKNGEMFPTEHTVSLLKNDLEEPIGIVSVVRDITERKQAEEALRESETRYRLVARATFDAIWDWHLVTNEVWWNEGIQTLFGYSADEVGPDVTWWYENIQPEQRERVLSDLHALINSGGQFWLGEYRYRRADGSYACVLDRGYVMHDDKGKPVRMIGAMVDITERKRVEVERARYAAQLKGLAEASLVVSSTLSLDEVLKIVTEKAREIIGAHQSVTSMTVDENWAQAINTVSLSDKYAAYQEYDEKPDGSGIYRLVCQMNRPMRMTQAELEAHPAWRGFGKEADKHPPMRGWLAAPLTGHDGRNIGLIQLSDKYEGEFTDDDEAILVQLAQMASVAVENARLFEQVSVGRERLQTLSHRLVQVQDAERRHIARELHDEIGQLLTGLKLALEMSTHLPADAIRGSLGEALALVNEVMAKVRELSLDLRPAMLDDLGLLPALLWHFERYTAHTNVDVVFKHTGLEGPRFPPDVETAVYRIVQEALTNVARHAGVSEVTVRLWADDGLLNVQIEDQGASFDPEAVLAAADTSGLAGMRERAVGLNGQLTVESAPGAGTRVTAELPLRGPLEREKKSA